VDVSGLGVVAVGLVLCFYGRRSLQVAVLASGFALGWLLAEGLDADVLTTAAVAVVTGLAGWAVTRVVAGAAVFFVGALAGGVVGAKLFGLLQQGEGSVVLALLFVAAVAVVTGVATQRFRGVMLAAACALGGAGLALSGAARTVPEYLGFLRVPPTPGLAAVAALLWLALASTGWGAQRRKGRIEDRQTR
jgi:hypothetical protein